MKISIIIPALNEEAGIGAVIDQIPSAKLESLGYQVELIVVDNASVDRTAEIARSKGATVVQQPLRGYGNAYKAGFAAATGEIIATGDADMTYPFDTLPELIGFLIENDLDFLNTDRLSGLNAEAMTRSHILGNEVLSLIIRLLFRCPFRDSQSGMWIFKREIWPTLRVESEGMPFSQELKIEAFTKGFKCGEIPIEYRPRVGEVKLDTLRDGWRTVRQIAAKRLQREKAGEYEQALKVKP